MMNLLNMFVQKQNTDYDFAMFKKYMHAIRMIIKIWPLQLECLL